MLPPQPYNINKTGLVKAASFYLMFRSDWIIILLIGGDCCAEADGALAQVAPGHQPRLPPEAFLFGQRRARRRHRFDDRLVLGGRGQVTPPTIF